MHLLVLYFCQEFSYETAEYLYLTIPGIANISTYILQVKKCPRCKKDLKGIGKIEKHIQAMHRDFRQIMDDIQESTAEANIKKYSVLLTEIEKVRSSEYFTHIKVNSGVQDAMQGGYNLSTDPTAVFRSSGE